MIPKFSIVTPAYNSERFIAEAIESVISQKGGFSIEYIIMDNCSTDETLSIAEEYKQNIESGARKIHCDEVQMTIISEPDSGMYDAINKGFSHATGNIYAWINSDDMYLPGAFSAVQRSLEMYPQINWIKGITSYIDVNSSIYSAGKCHLYVQEWIREGIYGPVLYFIQQDSVFWRSDLWELVENEISQYSLAGDYFIWRRFAEHHALYSLNAFVSCFRKVSGQKSEAINRYWEEANSFNSQLAVRIRTNERVARFFPESMRPFIQKKFFGNQQGYVISLTDSSKPVLHEGFVEDLVNELA